MLRLADGCADSVGWGLWTRGLDGGGGGDGGAVLPLGVVFVVVLWEGGLAELAQYVGIRGSDTCREKLDVGGDGTGRVT